jgi:hypothetical protein
MSKLLMNRVLPTSALFISGYDLFNDTVSSPDRPDYTASNGRMTGVNELQRMFKEAVVA